VDPTLQVQPSEKKQFTGPESPYPTGSDYSKPWLAAGKAGKERAAAKKAEEVGKAKKEREAAKKAEEVENAKKDQAVDEKRRYLARWTAEMLEELEGMSNPSGGDEAEMVAAEEAAEKAAEKVEGVEGAKKDLAAAEKRQYLARWTAEMLEELEGMSNPSGGGKRRRRTKRKKSMRKKKSTKKRRTKSSKRKSRRRR